MSDLERFRKIEARPPFVNGTPVPVEWQNPDGHIIAEGPNEDFRVALKAFRAMREIAIAYREQLRKLWPDSRQARHFTVDEQFEERMRDERDQV